MLRAAQSKISYLSIPYDIDFTFILQRKGQLPMPPFFISLI